MEKLVRYSHSRFENLIALLEKCRDVLNPETLHEVRIEFKKIKAVYRLLDQCVRGFNYRREYEPLQRIFKKAGAIRDADVLRQLYIVYKIRKQEKNILGTIRGENKRIAAFRKKATSYIIEIEKQEERTKSYLKKFKSSHLEDYFVKLENKLSGRLTSKFREDKLHTIRKRCKEIIYLSKLDAGRKNARIKLYDKLQELIGSWHDKTVLVDILEEEKDDLSSKSITKLNDSCKEDIKKIKPLVLKLRNKF